MKEALLEVRDLTVSFDFKNHQKEVVKNFNLTLQKGEALGLVGESGSGKSISMLAVTRLLPPQATINDGKIVFMGSELSTLSKNLFYSTISGKQISMIFQEPMTALNPVYSVGRQLEKAYLRHNFVSAKEARIKAIELLERVRLSHAKLRLQQFPHELSGGQRQRVMIALALINQPKVLIADEPTTALDVTVQREIIELINELRTALDMALIFISHDLAIVSNVADKMVFMEKAKIVESGNTKQILKSPKHEYTKTLLASFNNLDKISSGNQKRSPNLVQAPLVKVCDLSKSYKMTEGIFKKPRIINAVKKVSLEVRAGETLAIVGESGSGKTTLAKMIGGLLRKSQGNVYLGNTLVEKIDNFSRAKLIQPIFQDPYSSLNPQKTVGQILEWPLKLHENMSAKEREDEIVEVLCKVGLSKEYINRYPNQMSGGQRQRVAIARAVILKPKILLCDEPTSALDATIQNYILDLIQNIKQELDAAVILITHDISVVKYLADRVIVMYNGEIVEAGLVDAVIGQPKKSYTKALLSSIFKIPRIELNGKKDLTYFATSEL